MRLRSNRAAGSVLRPFWESPDSFARVGALIILSHLMCGCRQTVRQYQRRRYIFLVDQLWHDTDFGLMSRRYDASTIGILASKFRVQK
jgi:hypothetical protein